MYKCRNKRLQAYFYDSNVTALVGLIEEQVFEVLDGKF